MSTSLTVAEAAKNLAQVVSDVRRRHERVVLFENGQAVAELAPVAPRGKTGAEIAANWSKRPHLSPEDAESFARDIELARRELPPLRDPWA